jgi:hypothetical protein
MIREMNINGLCRKTEGNRVLRRYRRRQTNDIKNDIKKEVMDVRPVDLG